MPALARKTAVVHRKPVSSSPKFQKIEARLKSVGSRARIEAARNEQTILTLAGAMLPAVIQRFSGKPLPTLGNIDPGLLYGGVGMVLATQLRGRNRDRVMAIATGCAAPALSRAVQTGSVKVAGEDDYEETAGDDSDEI